MSGRDHDKKHAAEVRITFKSQGEKGYWSLVGTENNNPAIQGGGPNQASMDLEGFEQTLPEDWSAVVMHEMGHALGFEHEHQSPAGGCDFRFDDDPGYIPTKDAAGWYIQDSNSRRPGLYTYLGGYANFWPEVKVDANLRVLPTTSAFLTGAFDKMSIMKYFFGSFMFVSGTNSPCYTESENLVISAQDYQGIKLAYPIDPAALALNKAALSDALRQVQASTSILSEVRESAASRMKADALQ